MWPFHPTIISHSMHGISTVSPTESSSFLLAATHMALTRADSVPSEMIRAISWCALSDPLGGQWRRKSLPLHDQLIFIPRVAIVMQLRAQAQDVKRVEGQAEWLWAPSGREMTLVRSRQWRFKATLCWTPRSLGIRSGNRCGEQAESDDGMWHGQ